jgi:hypothetical protein
MTANTSTNNSDISNRQAVAFVPIIAWIVANWPSILAVLGTAAFLVMKAGELTGGKEKSNVYKAMSSEQQKKVDSIKQDLDKAILREDTPGVVKYLRELAKEYSAASKIISTSNPALGKEAKEMADAIKVLASEAQKGVYKFKSQDIGLNVNEPNTLLANNTLSQDNVSGLAIESTSDSLLIDSRDKSQNKISALNIQDVSSSLLPAQNTSLAFVPLPVVVQVIEKVLKSLGETVLTDENATQVVSKLLQMKVLTPEQIQDGLEQYYEQIKGLSPEESVNKAEKIINEATNDSGSRKENSKQKDVEYTPG